MSTYEIALEYKDKHLTRPELQKIIGAALTNRTDVKEVIIRCRSAAQTTRARLRRSLPRAAFGIATAR